MSSSFKRQLFNKNYRVVCFNFYFFAIIAQEILLKTNTTIQYQLPLFKHGRTRTEYELGEGQLFETDIKTSIREVFGSNWRIGISLKTFI